MNVKFLPVKVEITTVGELRAAITNIPDDVKVDIVMNGMMYPSLLIGEVRPKRA